MIGVLWACGHSELVGENAERPSRCASCGETRRWRVTARPPRFTGTVSGPYATTTALAPIEYPFVPAKET